MKAIENIRNKKIEEYVFITQIIFILLTGILVVRSINNFQQFDIYLYKNLFFLLILIIAFIFCLAKLIKQKVKHYYYRDNILNVIYLTVVIFYLAYEKEGFFKLLLLMPVMVSALRYGLKAGCIWAFLGSVGLAVICFVQRPEKLDTDVFMIGVLWLLAWLLGKMSETELEIRQGLEKLASQDGLTGLYNHRSFFYYLDEYYQQARQKNSTFTLIMLDVDFFKYYNDAYGHRQGDKVLKLLSGVITGVVGKMGICARYGGDEFTILIPDCDGICGYSIGENIRKEVAAIQVSGMNILPGGKFTISVGVASFPEHASSKERLLQIADEALYKAKYTNKNKVELYYSVFDEIGHTLVDKEKDLLNSLRTLLMVVNAKDKYTYGHSERVMHYAVQLGRRLALWEWEIQNLTVGSLLHDIGKIEVSREILNKATTLHENEWQDIKSHSIWGADMIRPISALSGVVDIVLYHHENYDGSGYPLSVGGADIPLEARILRVVDSFDAMTTNRPYKEVLTFSEALSELVKYKGIYYDPEIVDLFTVYIRETGILS